MENLKDNKKNICSDFCCTKIENLSVSFGTNKILNNINLHFHCGDLTCIIGPNGAGKSTLLKSLLGEIKHSGKLTYVSNSTKKISNPVIGYVPQYLTFDLSTPASVLDLFVSCNTNIPVWFYSSKKYRSKVTESLSRVNAEYLIDRKLGALSGGELQRVLLALALDPMPNILLLDEPVSGIDQNGLELFYSILQDVKTKYDLSIILVSHDLDLVAKYADKVVLLKETVLCNGTPKEVFTNPITSKIFGLSWYNTGANIQNKGGKSNV